MGRPAVASDQPSSWRPRRVLSATVRVLVTLVPVALSFAVAIVGHRILPDTVSTVVQVAGGVGILVLSLIVLAITDSLARRFLPLAALLQLSLAFPDQTPSRFKLALKGGSGRHMARVVREAKENGVSDVPALAAEQLLLMATAIGDHDRRTRGHSERVRLYAELIGEELHLSGEERSKLQWAALIHDIGKITVPPEILNKKGKPDDREWRILQNHPAAGEDLATGAEQWLGEWIHAVGGHHEKWDGSGYPRGLVGDAIPRSAAIVAVADAFEVMTAVRSYKKAMPLPDARRELTRCAGSHFSPDIVRAFLQVSIGDLRRSMGIFAALAHVPLIGRVATAAAHAPDAVATTVGVTTSAATAGAGAVAVTAAMSVTGPPSMALAATPAAAVVEAPVAPETSDAAPYAAPTTVPVVEPEAVPAAVETHAVAESDDEAPTTATTGERGTVARPAPRRPGPSPSAATTSHVVEHATTTTAVEPEARPEAEEPVEPVEAQTRSEEKAVEQVAKAEQKAPERAAPGGDRSEKAAEPEQKPEQKAEQKAAEQAVRAEKRAADKAQKPAEQPPKAEEKKPAEQPPKAGQGPGGGGKPEDKGPKQK